LLVGAYCSAGVLLAAKGNAGKGEYQNEPGFYLDSFSSLTYLRTRSGVEKFPRLFFVWVTNKQPRNFTGRPF
jgi:hypothetical protein